MDVILMLRNKVWDAKESNVLIRTNEDWPENTRNAIRTHENSRISN